MEFSSFVSSVLSRKQSEVWTISPQATVFDAVTLNRSPPRSRGSAGKTAGVSKIPCSHAIWQPRITRLTDPNTMRIDTTITDPDVLTVPYVSTRTLSRHRTWTIAEYICEENNRNFVDEKGKAGINLANPGGLPPKKE